MRWGPSHCPLPVKVLLTKPGLFESSIYRIPNRRDKWSMTEKEQSPNSGALQSHQTASNQRKAKLQVEQTSGPRLPGTRHTIRDKNIQGRAGKMIQWVGCLPCAGQARLDPWQETGVLQTQSMCFPLWSWAGPSFYSDELNDLPEHPHSHPCQDIC